MKNERSFYTFLLFASFVEGGSLMAVELLSTKVIAPYYGASLYVWATILGVTMGGLAIGYFAGGILSEKRSVTLSKLMMLFCISAVLTFLIPYTAHFIMESTLDLDIRVGILISCLIFLLPPVAFFGLISPITIRLLIKNKEGIGFSTGLIYTISTIGGILFTFLTGFFLISTYGVKFSINLISIYLMVPPLIYCLLSALHKIQFKNE